MDCIYEKYYSGSLYEPPESWCDINEDHDCENCPYYFPKDDYEDERLDYEYEFYRESFDF